MAITATEYGVALFYGLRDKTSITYMVVQSDDLSQSIALDVEVADEEGRVITDHLDDKRKEITIEGVLKISDDIPDISTQFTYNTVQYILKSIDDKGSNKDYRKVSVKGIKYQQIA
jgi:hypothetical protein